MAGIVKKQILKYLSRFTKNLSPDQLKLSTLKGEGKLSNLELNEEVLQNILGLPAWLAITRVNCNKAIIRIQWTKLKTSPICLSLDKVEVEMRTCEEPRTPCDTAGKSEYGFVEKVMEGMSVTVDSVTVRVQARDFHASFQVWQLQGHSVDPRWQHSDLPNTRITDPKRGEVLTFKEIKWKSLRMEVYTAEGEKLDQASPPLPLLANHGRIRVTLKRRVKDSSVSASKLLFIIDNLLWATTAPQLQVLVGCALYLSKIMDKSGQRRKSVDGAYTARPPPGIHHHWVHSAANGASKTLSRYFEWYNIKESSYHLLISHFDLRFDNQSSDEAQLQGSLGAMRLTLWKLGFDCYPFHLPADGCKHWDRHCGAMESWVQWTHKLQQGFPWQTEGSDVPGPDSGPSGVTKGSTMERQQANEDLGLTTSRRTWTSPACNPGQTPRGSLRSLCMVLRVENLDVQQMSTVGNPSKKTRSMLSCNRKALHLADSVSAVHLQFTEYFFLDSPGLPVPCPNLYAQVNGLQLLLDPVNLLPQGIPHTMEQVKAIFQLYNGGEDENHMDICVDAAKLKLVIPVESSVLDHSIGPQSLTISVSQAILSNTQPSPHDTQAKLHSTYHRFSSCPFLRQKPPLPFPWDCSAFHPLPPAFLLDPERERPQVEDIWAIRLSCVALSFEEVCGRPTEKDLPFVDPFTMSIWMCCPAAVRSVSDPKLRPGNGNLTHSTSEGPEYHFHSRSVEEYPVASLNILAQSTTPIKVWLNHYQYLALLRMREALVSMGAEWEREKLRYGRKPAKPLAVCAAFLMDAVEVGLLLPPVASGPEEETRFPVGTHSSRVADPGASHNREMLVESRNRDEAPSVPGKLGVWNMEHLGPQQSFRRAILDGSLPDDRLTLDSDNSGIFLFLTHSNSRQETMPLPRMSGLATDQADGGNRNKQKLDLSSSLSLAMGNIPQDMASVVLLQFSSVSCVVDVKGDDLVLALEAQELFSTQMCNRKVTGLPRGETLNASSPASPQGLPKEGRETPAARMRLTLGPTACPDSPRTEAVGFLELRLADFRAELLSSALTNLGAFFEDELRADVQPIRILLDRTTVTLQDDRPPIYPTSHQAAPVVLRLDQVVLERGTNGVFWLKANDSAVPKRPVASMEEKDGDRSEASWELPYSVLRQGEEERFRSRTVAQLQDQLSRTQAALACIVSDQERLMQEIRKYNPLFNP